MMAFRYKLNANIPFLQPDRNERPIIKEQEAP